MPCRPPALRGSASLSGKGAFDRTMAMPVGSPRRWDSVRRGLAFSPGSSGRLAWHSADCADPRLRAGGRSWQTGWRASASGLCSARGRGPGHVWDCGRGRGNLRGRCRWKECVCPDRDDRTGQTWTRASARFARCSESSLEKVVLRPRCIWCPGKLWKRKMCGRRLLRFRCRRPRRFMASAWTGTLDRGSY